MDKGNSDDKQGRRNEGGNRKPEKYRNPHFEKKENWRSRKGKFYYHKNKKSGYATPSHNIHVLWLLIIAGIWMVITPLSFDYNANPVSPSGGRQLWASAEVRAEILKWSDIISGLVVIIFSAISFDNKFKKSLWVCCGAGVWLNAAPLIFWSPSPMTYINDTLAGSLILAICLLSNKLPGLILSNKKRETTIPEGWTYNPSSWNQRLFLTLGGLAGWLISRYLASYQLGYIDTIWDPFFGDGTAKVLDSSLSMSLPVSDGGLGAFVYTFEFLLGWSGGGIRWKNFPWLVYCFGVLVVPLSITHVLLVLSQPVLVGNWCTLCLMAAFIMLCLIPLGADEIIAMGQYVLSQKKKGKSAWKVFWNGNQEIEENAEIETNKAKGAFMKSAFAGISFPVTLILSVVVGLWVTFSPTVLTQQTKSTFANIAYMAGLLTVVFAVIAMGEIFRRVRYMNIIVGIALAASVWFTDGSTLFKISSLIAGIVLTVLSIPMGVKKQSYGAWDKYIS